MVQISWGYCGLCKTGFERYKSKRGQAYFGFVGDIMIHAN